MNYCEIHSNIGTLRRTRDYGHCTRGNPRREEVGSSKKILQIKISCHGVFGRTLPILMIFCVYLAGMIIDRKVYFIPIGE